ncbi:MAG: poly-gamma-glutamate synthase PgsB [Christensenellaceae bacterium]|jgi:poly-gamma-glutamate synthase PgsB/CapB|nr:poly-gamma-glutamate synthase PgsB [Christensenellaceae bacterium]
MLWLFITFILYIGYLLYERWAANRHRAALRHVIHVNGIRGKTDTCRLIDAGLRQAGLRVLTKTTGNQPCYLGVDGAERPVLRLGGANIREQIRFLAKAARGGADALVLECMAVNPQLQQVCERQIVRSGIGVITNVRYDHLLEMGDDLPAIAASLANTIPKNGRLFTADAAFAPYFSGIAAGLGTSTTLCQPPPGQTDPRMENACLAAAVCEAVTGKRVSPAALLALGMQDYGACALYAWHNHLGEPIRFLNLFAVNDPQSALSMLHAALPQGADIVYLVNNRGDRPDRIQLFADTFFGDAPTGTIHIIGEAKPLALRLLRRRGFAGAAFGRWQAAFAVPKDSCVVGLCNIKGPGLAILQKLEEARA